MSEINSNPSVKTPRTRIEDIPAVGVTMSQEDLEMVSGGMRSRGACQCSCCSTNCGCDSDLDQSDM